MFCGCKSLSNFIPVDDFPDLSHEIWSDVLVVKVVGMLPDVYGQKWNKVSSLINESVLVSSCSEFKIS